jgi:predicted Zn-dependent protease
MRDSIRPRARPGAPSRFGRALVRLALLALLSGCAAPNSSATADDPSSSSPTKAYGRAFIAEALRAYRFVLDPDVTGPVQRTGRRLVEAIGEDPGAFHFFVVDEPQPNAFAIPGGYIFVFTGLLTKLADEDELAGVLAHEIGHVTHNHFFQDRKQVLALNLATLAALLLSGGHPAALAFPLGASYNLQLAYSREHEADADAAAVGYLRKAGYDPAGLARFFQTLEIYERFNASEVPAYFTTHPGVADRLRVVQAMAADYPAPEPAARRDLDDWGRVRASLGATPNGSSPATGRDPRNAYLWAIASLKQNRVEAAIAAYRAVLNADPRHVRARADLALALLKNRMLDGARDEAVRSLADDPGQALPSVVLGILAQDAGLHAEAITRFQAALAREPLDQTTHLRLAQAFAALDDSAGEAYHLARYGRLTLNPTQAAIQYERVRADPQADPELKRQVERELAELRREGV